MLFTETCLGNDVCLNDDRNPLLLLKAGKVPLWRYCGGFTYAGGCWAYKLSQFFLSWFCIPFTNDSLRCVGLKLTGVLHCVGVLQFDPILNGGGLKHGVFNLEFVGVWSGDIPCVGVLSKLRLSNGVFLFNVPVSTLFSPGGGGRDMRDSWLPVSSVPVRGVVHLDLVEAVSCLTTGWSCILPGVGVVVGKWRFQWLLILRLFLGAVVGMILNPSGMEDK